MMPFSCVLGTYSYFRCCTSSTSCYTSGFHEGCRSSVSWATLAGTVVRIFNTQLLLYEQCILLDIGDISSADLFHRRFVILSHPISSHFVSHIAHKISYHVVIVAETLPACHISLVVSSTAYETAATRLSSCPAAAQILRL